MANDNVLDVLQAAVSALQAGQRAALLTVVRSRGSTPRGSGAMMLLCADGTAVGTIGGGMMEESARRDALQALADGRPALTAYELGGPSGPSLGLCGGTVEVSIEVLMPATQLVIIGAGHIGQALASLAAVVGLDVTVVDDRPEWATSERFPTAKQRHVVAYDGETETLAPLPVQITPATAVVLATWGWDAPALRQVIQSPAFYIGMIGSRRKIGMIAKDLAAHGLDPALLECVHAPIGLDLGGETPGEIALAIMAEIQLVRRGGTGQPLRGAE